jgi:hypothetical protein
MKTRGPSGFLNCCAEQPPRWTHRRVGTAILFESSGRQTDKVAHLPESRFALGEPELDTTTIDNAAFALEDRSCYLHKAGSDGFRIGYQPTMKKVVSDRRASLDEETGQTCRAQARRGRVPTRSRHPRHAIPAGWGGDSGHAQADAHCCGSRGGVVRYWRAARAARRLDSEPRKVAANLSWCARMAAGAQGF